MLGQPLLVALVVRFVLIDRQGALGAGGALHAAAEQAETARQDEAERVAREADRIARQGGGTSRRRSTSRRQSTLDRAVGEASRTLAREIVKGLFRKRR